MVKRKSLHEHGFAVLLGLVDICTHLQQFGNDLSILPLARFGEQPLYFKIDICIFQERQAFCLALAEQGVLELASPLSTLRQLEPVAPPGAMLPRNGLSDGDAKHKNQD